MTDLAQSWQNLVSAALLGTTRRPWQGSDLPADLAAILPTPNPHDPEGTLLSTAAALALYQRAGQQPEPSTTATPPPAPIEIQPRCGKRAGEHLATLLNGLHSHLLPEWLAALRQAGQRIPEEHMPPLLDLGRRQIDLQLAIKQVVGQRGIWLAQQNPAWGYLSDASPEAIWQGDNVAARLLLLTDLRQQQPDIARELLAATWPTESATDRLNFLQTFEQGLSLVDAPFLENALTDRRQEVRQVAAHLLTCLPQSALSRRMAARSRPLLALIRDRHGATALARQTPRYRLQVSLPSHCDADMQHDGIAATPRPGLGERAWWLQQLLAATPLDTWTQAWQIPPRDIIAATDQNEWSLPLLEGWIQAAHRQGNALWAEGLLAVYLTRTADYSMDRLEKLLTVIPPERVEALIRNKLQTNRSPLRSEHPALLLLSLHHQPWSRELSEQILHRLSQQIDPHTDNADWQLRALLKDFARYLDPTLAPTANDHLRPLIETNPIWGDALGRFLTILHFRQSMLAAIFEKG